MSLVRFLPIAALAVIAAPLQAQPVQPFSLGALKAAQAAGKPVLVDAFAPWCPTCRVQKPVVDAVAADPRMAQAVVLGTHTHTPWYTQEVWKIAKNQSHLGKG